MIIDRVPTNVGRSSAADGTPSLAVAIESRTHQVAPLARHLKLRTSDRRQAAQVGARIMSPHTIKTSSTAAFEWVLHAVNIGQSALVYHSSQSWVDVQSTEPTDFFAVQVLLRGRLALTSTAGSVELSSPGTSCVVSPTKELSMRYAPGTEQIMFKAAIPTIERVFGQLTGTAEGSIVSFDLKIPAQSPVLSNMQLALRTIDSIEAGGRPSAQLGEEIERMLALSLLLAQPHSASSLIARPAVDRVPSAVASIADEIRSEPEHEVDFARLAGEHGISLRSLQNGFRTRYGRSPSNFLRDCRLDLAHRMLTSNSVCSVTEAAYASGFTHLGRFARDYRLRYGVSPSHTLRTVRTRFSY